MPMLDISQIANHAAFNMVSLTDAINLVPNTYGLVTQRRIFNFKGATTPTVFLDYKEGSVGLVPQAPRGGPATQHKAGPRGLKAFNIPHYPYSDKIMAGDLVGVRSFGAENQLATLAETISEQLGEMTLAHNLTHEFLQCGALRGLLLDPTDGSTAFDLFTEFGIEEKTIDFGTDGVAPGARAAKRHMEANLRGESMTGMLALCSPEFWELFIEDADVKAAYNFFANSGAGNPNRADMRDGFYHMGVTWMEYAGEAADINGDVHRFIPEGEARLIPLGTHTTFRFYSAPAEFFETVNTKGKRIYAKSVPDRDLNRWLELYTESNPLALCTRPNLLVRGTFTPPA